jgi:1-acyl-sn-glycerol-3-phosphate acyltransferase
VSDPDRTPTAWSTAPARRGPAELLREAVGDLRDLVTGRWTAPDQSRERPAATGQPGLVSQLRELLPHSPRVPGPAPTHWARQAPARNLRRLVHAGVTRPLLLSQVKVDIGGIEELPVTGGPVLLVANHASHLDIPLLLESLPAAYRCRTCVAVIPGSTLTSPWRTMASAAVFNTVPLRDEVCSRMLRNGWNVLLFGEPSRSVDGFVGEFTEDAARLAIAEGVRIAPIGIRGSFAAMPRGRNRPVLGWPGVSRSGPAGRTRPRVSVRFGRLLTAADDESTGDLTRRVNRAVKDLIVEDAGTWWQSLRDPGAGDETTPPVGSWRRIWAQSQSAEPGGQARRPRIWP